MRWSPAFVPRLVLLALFATAVASSFASSLTHALTAEQRRSFQRETLLLIEFLQGYHYSNRPIHEIDAAELLSRYFHDLDPQKKWWLRGDIAFLRRRFERNLKTVYLFKGDLHPAFEIYDAFAKRVRERCAWIEQRLASPIHLETSLVYQPDDPEAEAPATALEADALWEKVLVHDIIRERLRGRAHDDAIAEVSRQYRETLQRVNAADPLRVREGFLNALMGLFDPHCGYFSSETADIVSGNLTGAVSGIGIDLGLADGRFVVKRLQPGGPAERQGDLRPGDEFIGVSTAPDTPPRPLAGRRLREVVTMLRGEAGTRVSLLVRSPEGDERLVELERARMEIARHHASARLYQIPGYDRPVSVGAIDLPAFYGESEGELSKASMARDVAELLQKLRAAGAEAVVVDLRENGGGLINEAVGLIGLFTGKGPALLTRGSNGRPTVLRAEDPAIAFDGPLVVLASGRSASASEGFAGAVQAYRRGVIVGDKATFGKGTMQWFMPLAKAFPQLPETLREHWGVARVTRDFFYLPDGRSPQADGVHADIPLPDDGRALDYAERDLPHALPAARIDPPEPLTLPSTLAATSPELIEKLRASSERRQQELPEFVLEKQGASLIAEIRRETPVTLSLSSLESEYNDWQRRRVELRSARRALDRTEAFPVQTIDLDVVVENRRLHHATVRDRLDAAGHQAGGLLLGGTFYYRSSVTDHPRRIELEQIDWDTVLTKTDALTDTWAAASGRPRADITEEAVRAAVIALKLRDPDAPAPVPVDTLLRNHLGGLEAGTFSRAAAAFLQHCAEIDVDALNDHRALDVRLRESLRIAADWAVLRSASAPVSDP